MGKLVIILGILLGNLLSGREAPSEAELLGRWGCTGNRFVFMEQSGPVPDKGEVDARLKAMGASRNNCVLTFFQGYNLNFRVGEKSFSMKWTLDENTHEFTTTIGLFKISGFLVRDSERLILVCRREDLFLIMRFLCTASGRKNIAPLGELLDSTEGLTVAMEFSKL